MNPFLVLTGLSLAALALGSMFSDSSTDKGPRVDPGAINRDLASRLISDLSFQARRTSADGSYLSQDKVVSGMGGHRTVRVNLALVYPQQDVVLFRATVHDATEGDPGPILYDQTGADPEALYQALVQTLQQMGAA